MEYSAKALETLIWFKPVLSGYLLKTCYFDWYGSLVYNKFYQCVIDDLLD